MLDTIEEWLSLIVGAVFIGFVFLVIAFIFRSPILWLFLGLLAAILFFFPIARTLLTMESARRSRQTQSYEIGHQGSQNSASKRQQTVILTNKQQQQPVPKNKQQPEIKTSIDDPDVQNYVPPGLPPELFL